MCHSLGKGVLSNFIFLLNRTVSKRHFGGPEFVCLGLERGLLLVWFLGVFFLLKKGEALLLLWQGEREFLMAIKL